MESFVKDNLLELRETLWNNKFGVTWEGVSLFGSAYAAAPPHPQSQFQPQQALWEPFAAGGGGVGSFSGEFGLWLVACGVFVWGVVLFWVVLCRVEVVVF